jgi:5-methylthioadenosine/S-adenosylhomocysteine deaminase
LLIVDAPPDTDVYASLVAARETAVQLVVIDGRAVVGEPALMSSLGAAGEPLTVGNKPRMIDYGPGDPKVPPVTYAEARNAMADALQRLPHLLADEAAGRGVGPHALARPGSPWRLALDEQLPTGFALRPRLPLAGEPTGPDAFFDRTLAAIPLEPVALDLVSVSDDPGYANNLQAQRNLPAAIKEALRTFYPS